MWPSLNCVLLCLSLISTVPFSFHLISMFTLLMELLVKFTVYKSQVKDIIFLFFTVEGMDYGTLDVDLMFDECMRRKCVNVTIMEDQMKESNETFSFYLNRTTDLSARIILDPVDGESYLIDDDNGELRSINSHVVCQMCILYS